MKSAQPPKRRKRYSYMENSMDLFEIAELDKVKVSLSLDIINSEINLHIRFITFESDAKLRNSKNHRNIAKQLHTKWSKDVEGLQLKGAVVTLPICNKTIPILSQSTLLNLTELKRVLPYDCHIIDKNLYTFCEVTTTVVNIINFYNNM